MTKWSVTFAQAPSGHWAATATSTSPPVLLENASGDDAAGPLVYLHYPTFNASGATPWEASAKLFDTRDRHPSLLVGRPTADDSDIQWASLPWQHLRIAYGIVLGVAELIGATDHAKFHALASHGDRYTMLAGRRMLRSAVADRDNAWAQSSLDWAERLQLRRGGHGKVVSLLRAAVACDISGRRKGRRLARRALRILDAEHARRWGAED